MKPRSSMYAGCLGLVVKGRRVVLAVLVTAIMALLASQALAQEATIVGTVTDSTGAVVPGATIKVTSNETGITRSLVTNGEGQYVAPSLVIGRYTVRVEAKGFKVAEQKGIVLNVADRSRIDFKLEPGNVQETVSVEANAVAVQSDSNEISTVINGQQVSELGTNGRTVLSFLALTPGASSLQGDLILPLPVSGDNTVSINGQRAGHNIQLLDGSENLDRGGSGPSVAPSVEAIEEFRSLNSNYSAEYGLSSAGTFTNVVKSGGKQLHGSLWEYARNDAFDARNFFNPKPNPVAELRFNVYGFNVGGQVPVWKEHPTFFFYNMEWRKIVQGGLLNQTVPYTQTYLGDFTGFVPGDVKDSTGALIPHSGLHAPCQNQLNSTLATAWQDAGQAFSTPDADGHCAVNSKVPAAQNPTFVPLNLNALPANLLDANAQTLLNAGGKYGGIFPGPTNGQKFQGGNNAPIDAREETARVDHQFSPKFSVFGHWISEQISQTYGTTQWSGDNVPSIGNTFGNPSYSAVVHTTYVINPTLLNEASFNYNGNRINIIPAGLFDASKINGTYIFDRLYTAGPNANNRLPGIALSGATGTNYQSNWTPWVNKADDYQFRDDLSWTKGAHQMKMGFSWAIYKKIQDWFADTQGNFSFNGQYTGNDFADFLLGYASGYNEDAVKQNGHWNNISMALYFQDNWRVTPRLTLNLGLRWDGAPHTYEANHLSSNFYPGLYSASDVATFDNSGNICKAAGNGCTAPSNGLGTSPNPLLTGIPFYLNGIGIGGVGSTPKGLAHTYWPAFGPRIGFAYDVTGTGKTVVRGGFGIMYDRIQGNDMYNGATNTPNDAHASLNPILLSTPGSPGTITQIQDGTTITAASLPILPLDVTGIAIDYKPPTSYQYSFGVQHSLTNRAVLGVSYVGNQVRHLNGYRAINLPDIADLPGLFNGGLATDPTLAYPGFKNIRLSFNEANSHYNSLQVDLHGNLTRDLQLQFGYTYSKAVDAATSSGSGADLANESNPYVGWKYDVGPSNYDRRNVAFVNYVYQLPFFRHTGNHFVNTMLGGWQISGITTFSSGAPLNMGVNGHSVTSILGNTNNRPDLTGHISYPKKVGEWFDPSAFSAPACATGPDCWGNLAHNAVIGPGRQNWNVTVEKRFMLSESRGSFLELRCDSFNTWNHTQFKGDYNQGGISTNVGADDFGHVTGAFDPRVLQLGVKLYF